jgi:hypothetical protein
MRIPPGFLSRWVISQEKTPGTFSNSGFRNSGNVIDGRRDHESSGKEPD